MGRSEPRYICTNCGFEDNPVSYTPGSFWIELALWICFLLPGLIYSDWRLSARKKVCPKCKSPNMIPLDSPMGKKLHQEYVTKLLEEWYKEHPDD